MNGTTWLHQARQRISPLDAELILAEVLGLNDRAELVLCEWKDLSPAQLEKLNDWRDRRERFEPLAYLLGRKEFFGREFLVTPDVLIPRPETEMAVELVQSLDPDRVIDVGTGSGAIAISVALETDAEVLATDISEKALAVARKNAERQEADERVEFVRSDLLTNIPKKWRKVDVMVANLPYVWREWEWLGPELEYEPEEALYEDRYEGMGMIMQLMTELAMGKVETSYLVLETDPYQFDYVDALAKKLDWFVISREGLQTVLEVFPVTDPSKIGGKLV